MPLSPILRDVFERGILRQSRSGSFLAPSRHTGEAVCAVTDHSQVVRNRLRFDPELSDNAGFIARNIAPAVQLNDACADNTLTEIFIWRTNQHLPHPLIQGCL